MVEKNENPKLYDHRVEGIIHSSDVLFVIEACSALSNIKFQYLTEVNEEGEEKPKLAPEGFTWIKMRADLKAGQGFDFVFEKATQLKQDSENIIKFTNPYLSSSSDKPK